MEPAGYLASGLEFPWPLAKRGGRPLGKLHSLSGCFPGGLLDGPADPNTRLITADPNTKFTKPIRFPKLPEWPTGW